MTSRWAQHGPLICTYRGNPPPSCVTSLGRQTALSLFPLSALSKHSRSLSLILLLSHDRQASSPLIHIAITFMSINFQTFSPYNSQFRPLPHTLLQQRPETYPPFHPLVLIATRDI